MHRKFRNPPRRTFPVGALGENCHRFLSKGRAVAIDGRLEWREWTHDAKREAVEIVADAVQFLASGTNSGHGDAPAAAAAGDDKRPR